MELYKVILIVFPLWMIYNVLFEILKKLKRNKFMRVVYKHNYGNEAYGKVIETEVGIYKCYTTPLFGGEWQEQEVFKNKEEAIEYIKSLT